MKFEMIIKYKLITIILLFPILCYLTRKISTSLNSNIFKDFNDKSFYGKSKFIPKNNLLKKEYHYENYTKIRIFAESNYNKVKFHFKLSKEKYYDTNNIEFEITLKNGVSVNYPNDSIIYFSNNSEVKNIKFKEYKTESLLNKKSESSFNNIELIYNKKRNSLECNLSLKDFDFIFYLSKAFFSLKFFYLYKILLYIIFYILIGIKILHFQNNLQNISIIFLLLIRIKLVESLIMNFVQLYKVGIPIIKILIFYFHLLIYGDCLLTITDILITLITFTLIIISIFYLMIMNDNERNYDYCFNNFIYNGQIIKKKNNINLLKYKIPIIILYSLYSIFCYKNCIYFETVLLIFILIFTIFTYLFQREVMTSKDKKFCIQFYFYGIIIYCFLSFIYNIERFYQIEVSFHIFGFIVIFSLYKVLKYVITNDYKIKYIMATDFKYLKYLDKECCSICLKEFNFNQENEKKFFCKISVYDNIHKAKCNHFFHEKCLFIWRIHRNKCPICKINLDVPKYYYFYEYTPYIYK